MADTMRLRVQPASVDTLSRAIVTGTIRALSVRQPWATLLVAGYKTTENRDWRPHERLLTDAGGWLLVHASKIADTPRAHREIDDVARQHVGPLPREDVDTILRAIAGVDVAALDEWMQSRVAGCVEDLRMADTTCLHYLLAAKQAVDGKGGGQRTGAILGAVHVEGFSGGEMGEWEPADPWKEDGSIGWHVDAAIDFHVGVAANGSLGLWAPDDATRLEIGVTRPLWRLTRYNGALVLPATALVECNAAR